MQQKSNRTRYALLSALLAAIGLVGYGCHDSYEPGSSTRPVASARPEKGGAQLWQEDCMRCHSLRPPSQHSNDEWAVIVHHMRVRANLTGEESDRILAFIKSANATN